MAGEPDAARSGYSALTAYLASDDALVDVLAHVADVATWALCADTAAITALIDGRPTTLACSDPEGSTVLAAQYDSDSGPTIQAMRTNRTVTVSSVVGETRWPAFTRAARRHGFNAVMSVPVAKPGEAIGALTVYASQPLAFNFQDEPVGAKIAAQAAVLIVADARLTAARQANQNLQRALDTQSTISCAVGIIVAGTGHNPHDAFQQLVDQSHREHRPVREIADDIIRQALEPGTTPVPARAFTSSLPARPPAGANRR